MFVFPAGSEPPNHFTRSFMINSNECVGNPQNVMEASVASLCNIFQEVAGNHANRLGIGIEALQQTGKTWMLGRLSLRIHRTPRWEESVDVTTWPCGVRGKLMAMRHFVMTTASGEVLVEAASEWLYVDLTNLRIARVPPEIVALATEQTLQLDIGQNVKFFEPSDAVVVGEATLAVRRGDIDANRHVNNVHYTEWAMETVPEETFFHEQVTDFDIHYKQAAHLGDVVCSVTERGAELPAGCFIHRITRKSDGVVLALARSQFQRKGSEA